MSGKDKVVGKIEVTTPTYIDVVPGMILKQVKDREGYELNIIWLIDNTGRFRRFGSDGTISPPSGGDAYTFDFTKGKSKWEIISTPTKGMITLPTVGYRNVINTYR